MNENEIIRRCKAQLNTHHSISVWYFLTTIPELYYDEILVRRIQAKILEDRRYVENAEIDYKGFNRICLNPEYERADESPTSVAEKNGGNKKPAVISEAVNAWFIVIAAAVILGFVLTNIRLSKLQEQVKHLQSNQRSN